MILELFSRFLSGTGKTYIGLRILEALLVNNCPEPLLLVSNTNRTLDRMLEGILKFCNVEKMLRISGGSKSKILEKCNLSSVKSKLKLRGEAGDIAAAKSAKIIGVTAASAAKYRHIIDVWQPKVTSNAIFEYVLHS